MNGDSVGSLHFPLHYLGLASSEPGQQCDQKKIAKCLQKLPKNDFTRNMIYFNTFTKIA